MEKAMITGVKKKKPIPTSSKLKLDGELSMTKSQSKNSADKDKPMIDKTLFVTRLILINPSKNATIKNKKKNRLIKPASSVSPDPEP
ncbi:hypothetical protein [Fluviicola chungangensis]|uniref:Uncharacterized protein n=1 Tax=Fluviicola chungangensis TaxID=2597671 RepID=A0A556MQE3_9FLAO|nr:hypothetical protein [Fluviicola chungangensis]TSJ41969.1 hypothetical protein FO442_12825 [Fluviicola chungangensis]